MELVRSIEIEVIGEAIEEVADGVAILGTANDIGAWSGVDPDAKVFEVKGLVFGWVERRDLEQDAFLGPAASDFGHRGLEVEFMERRKDIAG